MTAMAHSRHASPRRKLAVGLVAGCLLLMAIPAVAKQSDRQQPMNYSAKHTDAFNTPNSVTTLTGNVKITQGTLLLTGDQAKIYLDSNSQIARVEVTGKLAHIQQLDDSNNLMTGDAAQLDYDNEHGIAVLTGQASVKQQGRGEFHGDKLTYNTQTSQITGDSNGDGLVHGVFLPKPRPVPAPAAAATVQPANASSSPAKAASSSQAPKGHR